ncbi:MAG: hypothetical protein HKN67_12370 [Saprospiraceae bacterium]|nr:hypothetical protein [Bacteroidia bacterium]MBT8228792.1 hypothetical protein [Bacteroidia bacterium]NNF22730.1 hypothetical protein [Saprospiraceae bacterium]NNK89086.1 hypothetical protein [Saprospiraceae bacterium]
MRILLGLSLCAIFIWSCEESREACLDLNASNFDFGAVSACDSCCTYPVFSLPVTLNYDSLTFDFDSSYVLSQGDTLSLTSFQFVLSDFQLVGTDSVYRIRNSLGSEESKVFDDFYLVRSNRLSSKTIGNTDFVDDIKQLNFSLGLDPDEVAQLKPYEFLDDDTNLSLVIDSLYNSDIDSFNIFEIKFNLNSIPYEFDWTSDEIHEFTFKTARFLIPGDSWSIDLAIDIKELFYEISSVQSADLMSEKLLENFDNSMSVN